MHKQPKPLPLSKRIIRDTSSEPPFNDDFGLARGAYKAWENESMQNALKAVDKGVSVRRAAEMYNVPRSTLYDRVSGKVMHGARSGPQPYLSVEEEEELTNFLLETAKIGYAHTRKQVIALVQQIVNSKGRATTVTNGWWERYVECHPQITLRVAVPFSYARAMATDREVIDRYFDMLEDCLRSNGLLNKPAVIFNCDETGLPLDPKSQKVVDRVGCKNPSYITSGSRSQITVLACTCAAGYPIPPMVIFDRMTLNDSMTKGEVPGSIYGLSHNGWITRKLFCEWFQHFLNSIPSVRPVILLLDGHSAHYCPETIRMAAKEKVILCALPPHTTHLTQPLDIGCFAPLKMAWREICHSFCASNPGRTVSRYDFCEVFAKAWYKSFTMPNIINSFKATGVCPLNRMAIRLPDDKDGFSSFKPSSLTEKTGLAYIPLYSPARPRATHSSGIQEMVTPTVSQTRTPYQFTPGSNNCSLSYMSPLSYSEPNLFDRSFTSSKVPAMSVPLPCASTISKFLVVPTQPSQIPTKHGKSAGRVLTSLENLQLIQEREKQKQEKALQKEERKRLREEKAKKKVEDAKKREAEKRLKKVPQGIRAKRIMVSDLSSSFGSDDKSEEDDLPEFTPPKRNTKKSKKSIALGSPDVNGLQQVAFSMRTTDGHPSKRETNGTKKSQKLVAFESPVLPDPQQAAHHVRSTHGRGAKRDATDTQKTFAIPSPDLPDSRQAALPVRITRGRAAKRDATDSNKTRKPGVVASLDSRQAALPVRITRGRAAKRDASDSNKTRNPGAIASSDLPDSRQVVRISRGHVADANNSKGQKSESSVVPESQESIRGCGSKSDTVGSKKTLRPCIGGSQVPSRIALPVRMKNGHADKSAATDSSKSQKPCVIGSLVLPDSQKASPSVRTTRGRAAKRDATNSNKTRKPGVAASPDLPDSPLPVRITRGRAAAKLDSNDAKKGQRSGSSNVPESQQSISGGSKRDIAISSKSQKPGAIGSLDLPDSHKAAPSVRTTRGRAAKRDATDSKKTQKPGVIASPYLSDSWQAVRTTRGRAVVKLDSDDPNKGQRSEFSDVPESHESIRGYGSKSDTTGSRKTLRPCIGSSRDLPDPSDIDLPVRTKDAHAAKRAATDSNKTLKPGAISSLDLRVRDSQQPALSARITRGCAAKKYTDDSRKGQKSTCFGGPDLPDPQLAERTKLDDSFTCNPVGSVDDLIVVSDDDSNLMINWWIEALGLYDSDKEVLLSQSELTDNIINAAQILLRAQFPSVGGFQNTLLGNKLQFKPVSKETSSIQIHHTGETHHWICSCSHRGSMIVQVLDSLGLFMPLNQSTVLQIAKIYSVPTDQSVLEIQKLSVQQQHGTLDCGLFSIAFAVEMCLGHNPQYASFNQQKMREHLYMCFRNGVITAFPKMSSSELLPRPSPVCHKVKIYCSCRMPEEYDEFMISCDVCHQWFHTSCVNIKADSFPDQWECYTCRN